jgi:hypothetical protein
MTRGLVSLALLGMIPDDQSDAGDELKRVISRWQARFLRERGKKTEKEFFSIREKLQRRFPDGFLEE